MKSYPLLHAVSAATYIGIVVLFMRFVESRRHDTPDTLLDGIGLLSLLVLSVAVMAFLFFYQPMVMTLQGRQKEGVVFFLKTIGFFSGIVVVILMLVSVQ